MVTDVLLKCVLVFFAVAGIEAGNHIREFRETQAREGNILPSKDHLHWRSANAPEGRENQMFLVSRKFKGQVVVHHGAIDFLRAACDRRNRQQLTEMVPRPLYERIPPRSFLLISSRDLPDHVTLFIVKAPGFRIAPRS